MKKLLNIGLLVVIEIVAIAIGATLVNKLNYADNEGYDERKTDNYETQEIAKHENTLGSEFEDFGFTKVLYYKPDNKIVRTSEMGGLTDMEILDEQNGYAVVRDKDMDNVYGPEGKSVFKEDVKNGVLAIVDEGRLITNRQTGEYFDLQGNPVSNLYTTADRLYFSNPDTVHLTIFAVLMLIGALLWYFLLWRRMKKA